MEKYELIKCCALCEYCIVNLEDESLTLNDFKFSPANKDIYKCSETMKLIKNDKRPTDCKIFLLHKSWEIQNLF